jgi:hypothetical protein
VKSYRLKLSGEVDDAEMLAAAGERARAAAEHVALAGTSVRWVRSEYAEDGSCFLVFEARSAMAVAEAGRRAGLDVAQIDQESQPRLEWRSQ